VSRGGQLDRGLCRLGEYFARLWHDQKGVTSVEYCILLGVLSVAALMAFAGLGAEVSTVVNDAGSEMAEATGGGTGCAH